MITEPRYFYKPFEYTEIYNFLKDQQRVHWLPEEVPLASDINDWKLKTNLLNIQFLCKGEKYIKKLHPEFDDKSIFQTWREVKEITTCYENFKEV